MISAAQNTMREENMTRNGDIRDILGLVGWHKDEETFRFTDLKTTIRQLCLNEL